jgi:oxygen-independent coproporphyrinogen-3 oxidase
MEEFSVAMFTELIDTLADAGYEQYEISNFAKNKLYSRHNSSYWKGIKYLGVGPSAHSFDGKTRQWNVSSMTKYFKGIAAGFPDVEMEELDTKTSYNDFIITGLRTMWGVDLHELQKLYGEELLTYCMKQAAPHLKNGLLVNADSVLKLTRQGIFISDGIMSDLLYV